MLSSEDEKNTTVDRRDAKRGDRRLWLAKTTYPRAKMLPQNRNRRYLIQGYFISYKEKSYLIKHMFFHIYI